MAKRKGANPAKFFAGKLENLGERLSAELVLMLDESTTKPQMSMIMSMPAKDRKAYARTVWAEIVNNEKEQVIQDLLKPKVETTGFVDPEADDIKGGKVRAGSAYEEALEKPRIKMGQTGPAGFAYRRGNTPSSKIRERIGMLKPGEVERLTMLRLRERIQQPKTMKAIERQLGPKAFEELMDSRLLERESVPPRGMSEDVYVRGGGLKDTGTTQSTRQGTSTATAGMSMKVEALGSKPQSQTQTLTRTGASGGQDTAQITEKRKNYDRLSVFEFDPKTGEQSNKRQFLNKKVLPEGRKIREQLLAEGGRVLSPREMQSIEGFGRITRSPQTEVILTQGRGGPKYTVLFRGFDAGVSSAAGKGSPAALRTLFFRGDTDELVDARKVKDGWMFALDPADDYPEAFRVSGEPSPANDSLKRQVVKREGGFRVKPGTDVHTRILQSGMSLPTQGKTEMFLTNWDGSKPIKANAPVGLLVFNETQGTPPLVKSPVTSTRVSTDIEDATPRGRPGDLPVEPERTKTSGTVTGRKSLEVKDPTGSPMRLSSTSAAPALQSRGFAPPGTRPRDASGKRIPSRQAPTVVGMGNPAGPYEIRSTVNQILGLSQDTPMTSDTFKKAFEKARANPLKYGESLALLESARSKSIEQIEDEILEKARSTKTPTQERRIAESEAASRKESARYKKEMGRFKALPPGDLLAKAKGLPALLLLALMGAGMAGGSLMGDDREAA